MADFQRQSGRPGHDPTKIKKTPLRLHVAGTSRRISRPLSASSGRQLSKAPTSFSYRRCLRRTSSRSWIGSRTTSTSQCRFRTIESFSACQSVSGVLGMTVDAAHAFFAHEPHLRRALTVVREVGLGYLRLGQPATELSGGEPSASSWRLSCSVATAATRCMCWTSQLRASIPRMSNG
jgi:hypothetical protein